MAAHQLMRPLTRNWTRLHHPYRTRAAYNHLLISPHISFFTIPSPITRRHVHFRSQGLKLPNPPVPFDFKESRANESDSESNRSRNEKKRLARRAVRWGMELANFSNPQIKRILKAALLEEEVYDAIMLVKRFGPDVREGKRRQFNYIGKLLRDVQPELMDALIQASKDGDHSRLQELSGLGWQIDEVNNEEFDESKSESEDEEEEESDSSIEIASKWFDGLINKDVGISNEIYSIRSIEFDRQELRKLVRKVHSIQGQQDDTEDENGQVDAALTCAKKSLTYFLRSLAKHMPSE